MPWDIRPKNNQFCIYKSDTDELVACHPTRAKAERQMAALYANVKEGWATQEMVAQVCPDCAKEMKAKGIDRLRIGEAIPAQMKAGLCRSLGGADGFFRRCMGKSFGDFSPGQKKNFCAWLKHECTGQWPGAGRRESMQEAKMKVEGGVSYPSSAFLVVEDSEQPSTWHLRVKDKNGKPDHNLMGAAWAALFHPGGHRGNKYEGPDKEKARAKLKAMYRGQKMDTPASESLILEARVEKSGREWDVTIIGAQSPDDIMTVNGRRFVVSKNGRLYDTKALEDSVSRWEGVKVYDNHLTQEEFERKQGMRSVSGEWLGTLVKPRWDKARNQLRATFKVVEEKLAAKLKTAHDQGILSTIGLSIDTAPIWGADVYVEGQSYPVVEGFNFIQSVDLVADPAAGGKFERLLASVQKELDMTDETEEKDATPFSWVDIDEMVSAKIADALAAKEAEIEEDDIEDMTDEEVLDAKKKRDAARVQAKADKAEAKIAEMAEEARNLQREAAVARTDLMLTKKLGDAKLPEAFENPIRAQFEGREAKAAEIDAAIKLQKEAYISTDASGRVKGLGESDVIMGMDENDKFEMAFMRILLGESELKALEANEDDEVKERLNDNRSYQAWIKAGRPTVHRYPKMSGLLYDYFKGDPVLDGRILEAASTSSLTSVVKNTVNLMAANSYSQREMWWQPIVTEHEVDTIDQATLVRIYGTDELPTVAEGAAYTEISLDDEEETASFVKRGGYIGITLETLMSDKINYVRRIPQGLADAWYNTQSDLVANVFTVNSATGPVLADSGALFNNTAASSATGHANLLTTALSHSEFGVVRTAMMKQTDQPLGDGRRLAGANVPRWLLVPVDLETTALEIRNSELVPGESGGATSGGQMQTRNLYMGSFDVIVVPPWTDADNWAAVSALPAIHLIYPRGQRVPQIFTADAETAGAMFTNDTLRFKTRLMTYRYSATYDCAPVSDWRPLHKSNV